MKVLIAGGGGYIGSILAPFLSERGMEITVGDAFWFGNYLPAHISRVHGDLFGLNRSHLESYDAMIFLAGLSNDPMAEYAPSKNFIYNTALPAYLGFEAREAGIRKFIYASSCSVYGYTMNKTFTEEDPAVSNFPYGVSKLQGERALLALASEEFQVIGFRQGTVSGYSPRMRLDLALNTMFHHALHHQQIRISNSKIWRPVLGLKDLCHAYLNALLDQDSGGGIYNISSFNMTVGKMAEHTAAFIREQSGKEVSIEDRQVNDYRNYKVSCDKARNRFEYRQSDTVEDILHELWSHRDYFEDGSDHRFYNIKIFQSLLSNDPTFQ